MAGLDDPVVLLRGGTRDGQLTTVTPGLQRLLSVSDAPGMLDVYELNDDLTVPDPETGEPVPVFELVGQRPADGLAPEMLHMPGDSPVPGDS